MKIIHISKCAMTGVSPPRGAVFAALLVLIMSAGVCAQTVSPSVTASGGGYLANTTGSISITIGQPATAAYSTTGAVLTQGFEQPELFLVTDAVSTSLCAGGAVNVPYIASGYYGSLNVFTAELSDAGGGFSSPVVIGTVTSAQSGSIAATIPANTIAGTGYRIRVVSSMPDFTGPDNGTDIAIHAPSPTITVSPSPTVSPGGALNTIYLGYGPQSVTLTATGGVSYSWSPSTYLSCTNCASTVMTPTAEGTYIYTVIATDAYGCTGTASVTIYVIDVFGGNNNNLVTICLNGQTRQVNPNAVQALLTNAHATIGPCSPKIAVEPQQSVAVSGSIVLYQNYPNPFNPSTVIVYSVPEDCRITLTVYDVYGRKVTTLVDEQVTTGSHSAVFNAGNLPSGMYTYVLESGDIVLKRKMVLMK